MSLVTVLLVFLLGGVVGAGLTAVILWGHQARVKAAYQEPAIDPEVPVVIDAYRLPAMVIGPHDEVLHSSARARTIGLVRGSRIGFTEVLDEVRAVRRSQQASSCEVKVRGDLGSPVRILSVRIRPLAREAVLAVAEDRSAVMRADASKRDFVANISHELKTPVGALQVLAETMQEAADEPEQVRHFSGRMLTESKRLGELVGQIIDLSRLQSDDPLMRAEAVDIDQVISAAADRVRERVMDRQIQFSAQASEGLRVVGDKAQLITAVTNLAQNAISYSDKGARVSVTARRIVESDDYWVDIAVTDNGIGISPEDQERIFERFYRVDYARSRASGGTGLGLSIVKHIAAVHGGTVSVWSKPGRGSTFTIRLPELLDEDARELAASSDDDSSTDTPSARL